MEKENIKDKAIVKGYNYADNKIFTNGVPDRMTIICAYASGYIDRFNECQGKPAETKDVVYIRKDEDGTPVGVVVQTLDERFEIALKDIDNGREMKWDYAMKFKLPTRKQAAIICVYIDDINAKLKEAGGEPMNKWYWTSSELYVNIAWFFGGSSGSIDYCRKGSTFSVRPVFSL